MEQGNLERLSALTALSRQRELTEEEQQERKQRREAYLKDFRSRFRAQLENTDVQYPDGTRAPLTKAVKKSKSED